MSTRGVDMASVSTDVNAQPSSREVSLAPASSAMPGSTWA
jgi:hypothetical protein